MFIVIDWLDGSGKGTQTKLVVAELEKQGKKVMLLDYPRYGNSSAHFVEKYLNWNYGKNVWAKAASIFYALDRYDDSFNFAQKMAEYDYIISNRYVSASMMHQAGKIETKDERLEYMKWLQNLEFEIFWIPKPDKVLFLDVPPEISQKLVEKKEARDYIKWDATKDLHEADENHLTNAYKVAWEILAEFPDWEKIDCCENGNILPIEVITQKILSSITENMNQIRQDKMLKEIMVVKNSMLFANTSRESKVYTSSGADFESQILKNYEFMVRWEAEENRDYKQPIPYAIVMNEKNEIFVYIRWWADSAAWDSRLHAKLSIWVGWHLEREEEGLENPLKDGLSRELDEEINLKPENITEIFPIGYINDDRNSVGEVHIGVSYVVKTQNFNPVMEDGELASGGFVSYEKLMEMTASWNYDVETWTELLAPEIKKYI